MCYRSTIITDGETRPEEQTAQKRPLGLMLNQHLLSCQAVLSTARYPHTELRLKFHQEISTHKYAKLDSVKSKGTGRQGQRRALHAWGLLSFSMRNVPSFPISPQ